MTHDIDPAGLASQPEVIENIEKASTRMVCQAVWDFHKIAKEQFGLAKDLAGTVGEDVTRDAMDTMGVTRVPTARLIGKIDYKRATYYFDPNFSVRQALFVDTKAEKGDRTSATIQISQTSMQVRMRRSGVDVDEPGQLDPVLRVGNAPYLVTTIFVKYYYEINTDRDNQLMDIFVVCLPNGMLQEAYNPTVDDTIWRAGRNAPTRGEDFRVRIAFSALKAKKNWRVQRIKTDPEPHFTWDN